MKKGVKSFFSVFSLLLILFSTFSFQNVSSQEAGESTALDFSSDTAGITPDSFWYFLDFTHTPEEYYHEAGLMIESGNIEDAQVAMEGFSSELHDFESEIESISSEGLTIETLAQDESTQTLMDHAESSLQYEDYYNSLSEAINLQIEAGVISDVVAEETLSEVELELEDASAAIEETRTEIVDEVTANSEVSSTEVEFAFEDAMDESLRTRFEEIARTTDLVELQNRIDMLTQEAEELESAGNEEQAGQIRSLLEMAESHASNCLHAGEINNEFAEYGHLQTAEQFVANAEIFAQGETTASDPSIGLYLESPTTEELNNEGQREITDAEKFSTDYESLVEKYSDDPARISALESEKERTEKVQELGEQLYEKGIMEKWTNDLTAQGLTGDALNEKIHEYWVSEWKNIYGDDYIPAGSYVVEKEAEPGLEVIPIGTIERIEKINPETGETEVEIIGSVEGIDALVKEGGGYALGVPYTDPSSGYAYTFNNAGYSYTTKAGIIYEVEYEEGYSPSQEYHYNYGDETFTFKTEEGNEVTYSSTGYEVKESETENTLLEQPYVSENVFFVDGSAVDNDPTGYIFNDNDGDAFVYAYNPEYNFYQDVSNGKVYIPPTAMHTQGTSYDPATGSFKYVYGGEQWSYSGEGSWKSATGQEVKVPIVPAPVGYEDMGTYTTQTGKTWTYDSQKEIWTESSSKETYKPAPNNLYRYDTDNARYVDANGKWSTENREGEYKSPWSYDTASNQWVSSATGDKYDSATGTITRSDGTVVGPENRAPGEGSEGVYYYGQYYTSEGKSSTYTYDYGSHYEKAPDGSYAYYTSSNTYSGPSSVSSYDGKTWAYNEQTGSWSSSDGQTYTAGQYMSGGHEGGPGASYPGSSSSGGGYYGGAYDSSGTYVGGSYGGYDSAGAYVGTGYSGSTSTGTYSGSSTTGTYSGTSGTYSGGSSGAYSGSSGSTGTYSGGAYSGGTSSGGTSSGGTSSGGDAGSYSGGSSGGSYSGGDSGGSYSGGGDSGGGSYSGGGGGGGDSGGGMTGGFTGYFIRKSFTGSVIAKSIRWMR